jgi:hypothetical protein
MIREDNLVRYNRARVLKGGIIEVAIIEGSDNLVEKGIIRIWRDNSGE